MRPTLLLRADGGARIGHGHLMRSLAMGEAWVADGGQATLAAVEVPDVVAAAASAAGIGTVVVAPGPEGVARAVAAVDPDWVWFDGYGFDHRFHRAARGADRMVAAVDDFGRIASMDADVVVDPNLAASAETYRVVAPAAQVRAGVRYVLLRQRFLELGPRPPLEPDVRQVLVTLGGAPDADVVDRVELALDQSQLTSIAVSLLRGRTTSDMASLMRTADLALSAAGTTIWELLFMGVPTVALPIVDNQEPGARALADAGVALVLPGDVSSRDLADALRGLVRDPAQRRALAASGRALVDGQGGRRIARTLKATALSCRPATADDRARIYEWSNDPTTRTASFSPDPIDWEDHVRWFADRLADPASVLLLCCDRHGEVGLFRAARSGDRAEVGVVVAPDRRGRGLAAPLIRAGSAWIREHRWRVTLDARIRPENRASQRAFEAAGYRAVADATEGPAALHYAFDESSSEES